MWKGFTSRADLSLWVGKPTFNLILGLNNNCWGRLLILTITIVRWWIRKTGFGPNTITDMINPQWGLILIIRIRILFAVTLFQHSPLTRRVFFISIRRERYASSLASGGLYRQYHLETLASTFTSHRKFSSSTTSSFSKECYHHLHQICISKNDTSSQH